VRPWPGPSEARMLAVMGALARVLAIGLILLLAPQPAAAANCVSMDDLSVTTDTVAMDAAIGRTRNDVLGRVVAPVMVNGRGPFRFIVDTGANRSVLSQELAAELGLTPVGQGEVHSVHDVTVAPLVEVNSIQYGAVTLPAQRAPLLEGPVLAGQAGLLGVDGMAGRRLQMDFARRCIEIAPARNRLSSVWTTIPGELRFGHLIVLHGRVHSIDVNVLVDTGADVSLANVALREAARGAAPLAGDREAFVRAYSAGAPVVLDEVVALPELRLGDLVVEDLIAYVGDFHIFTLWGLTSEPTLLIGMDVIRRTRAIAIDYSRATVSFRLERPPQFYSLETLGSASHRR
jgi:predicted aspartyl protease